MIWSAYMNNAVDAWFVSKAPSLTGCNKTEYGVRLRVISVPNGIKEILFF